MKWLFGKAGMWIFATVLAAGAAFAAAQEAQLPAGEGGKILESNCTACHGLDIIIEQSYPSSGWQSIVDQMLAEGADLAPEQIPVLVEYLAQNFGPKKDE
jgi:cytochrome c5